MNRIRQGLTSAFSDSRNKSNPYPPVFIILILFILGGLRIHARPQEPGRLVEELARRLEAYPKYENWTFRSVSVNREMTKNWTPKKTTAVEKLITVTRDVISERIVKATEEKGGKIKDLTQDRIRHAAEHRKREEKERSGREAREAKRDFRHESIYSIAMREVFPFGRDKRDKFDFRLLEETEINGRPVLVLRTSARDKKEDLFEGVYYIDKENLTLLKASLRPAKMPKLVKEFDSELIFDVLSSGHFVLKDVRVKIYGGIFIKHIRMEVEETYNDYEILN